MTNELEKQFFNTFGIEPKCYCGNDYVFEAMLEDECTDGNREKCKTCKKVGKTYPQITDHILLELMCIRCKELISIIKVKGDNREELKNYILKLCIEDYTFYSKTSEKTYNELANNFKQQVRTLFEDE